MTLIQWYLDKPAHLGRLHDVLRASCMAKAAFKCRSNPLHCEWITDSLLDDLLTGKISGFRTEHQPGSASYESALAAYLISAILPKKIADFYRRHGNSKTVQLQELTSEDQDLESQISWLLGQDLTDDLGERLNAKQIRDKLLACIDQLSPKLKQACTEYLKDKDSEEIADDLEINFNTLRTRLRDSVNQLKGCMALSLQSSHAGVRHG